MATVAATLTNVWDWIKKIQTLMKNVECFKEQCELTKERITLLETSLLNLPKEKTKDPSIELALKRLEKVLESVHKHVEKCIDRNTFVTWFMTWFNGDKDVRKLEEYMELIDRASADIGLAVNIDHAAQSRRFLKAYANDLAYLKEILPDVLLDLRMMNQRMERLTRHADSVESFLTMLHDRIVLIQKLQQQQMDANKPLIDEQEKNMRSYQYYFMNFEQQKPLIGIKKDPKISVYTAKMRPFGLDIILKVISSIDPKNQGAIAAIIQEIAALYKAEEVPISRYFGVSRDTHRFCLVTERVRGKSLPLYLHQDLSRPSWRKRVEIALACAKALDYLHSNKIVHTQLKGACFIVDEDGVVKLNDYHLTTVRVLLYGDSAVPSAATTGTTATASSTATLTVVSVMPEQPRRNAAGPNGPIPTSDLEDGVWRVAKTKPPTLTASPSNLSSSSSPSSSSPPVAVMSSSNDNGNSLQFEDIYALGIVLWEISVDGKLDKKLSAETIRASLQASKPPPVPPDTPTDYVSLLQRCLTPSTQPLMVDIISELTILLEQLSMDEHVPVSALMPGVNITSMFPSSAVRAATSITRLPGAGAVGGHVRHSFLAHHWSSIRPVLSEAIDQKENNIAKAKKLLQKGLGLIMQGFVPGKDDSIKQAYALFAEAGRLGNTDAMIKAAGCLVYDPKLSASSTISSSSSSSSSTSTSTSSSSSSLPSSSSSSPSDEIVHLTPLDPMGWYMKAAESGSGEAMYLIGKAYDDGHIVSHDSEHAIQWYTKAGEYQHTDAMVKVGLYQLRRGDRIGAAESLNNAVELNHSDAMIALGDLYMAENGVHENTEKQIEENVKKALALYRRAVQLGNTTGAVRLANVYLRSCSDENGIDGDRSGVSSDSSIGCSGDASTSTNTNESSEVKKDHVNIDNDDDNAAAAAAMDDDDPSVSDVTKGIRYLKLAVSHGNMPAMMHLAHCYTNGTGVVKDEAKAKMLLDRAMMKGVGV